MSKATLYRLPSRNVLVIEGTDGAQRVEYPASEIRGHQLAQDAGVEHLAFGRIEDLLTKRKK
jgi:hypothetical protein